MAAPDLPALATLFWSAAAGRSVAPVMRGDFAAADAPRIDRILAELAGTAEAERILRLPLFGTDMVDFDFDEVRADQ